MLLSTIRSRALRWFALLADFDDPDDVAGYKNRRAPGSPGSTPPCLPRMFMPSQRIGCRVALKFIVNGRPVVAKFRRAIVREKTIPSDPVGQASLHRPMHLPILKLAAIVSLSSGSLSVNGQGTPRRRGHVCHREPV